MLAEGVETQAQLDTLLEEQCDEAQGYLLGKPQAMGETVVEKAAKRRWERRGVLRISRETMRPLRRGRQNDG
ncbi:putative signal transduction protein with EAL and GGDEF domain [Rhizobium etli]|uniref:Putative signal transduction protein with EAL and GGDEF domain n=1 Tax=Rhizobium etli TaxID=29449 RepID=A0A7W6ZDF4_RHIET|nr:putative signal transduction protein with EAL and GGDEF domain [Rhizobium etli]MBB4533622.1 putative signal transduction protein with EAL and GGDEF domain [Rhizobium etli]